MSWHLHSQTLVLGGRVPGAHFTDGLKLLVDIGCLTKLDDDDDTHRKQLVFDVAT